MAGRNPSIIDERREHRRHQVPYLEWSLNILTDQGPQGGICLDVSQSGIGALLSRSVPVGMKAKVSIELPDHGVLTGDAKVVRASGTGNRHVGMTWVAMQPRLTELIKDLPLGG